MSQTTSGPDVSCDVVVIGTGSGGKLAAIELARRGLNVIAVERGRFGGECPYVSCVPAKSMLLSARTGLPWDEAVRRRDEITSGRDDQGSLDSLTEAGVSVIRGSAELGGRSQGGSERLSVRVAGTTIDAAQVVLGTGSSPRIPDLPGLSEVPTWTSDEALSATEQPGRLVILGGGPVGCELAQAFAQLGTAVWLIQQATRLLPRESPWVGALVEEQLRRNGVRVWTDTQVESVRPLAIDSRSPAGPDGVEVLMPGGAWLSADRLLIAGGRQPNVDGVGLASVDAAYDESPVLRVDERCRVLDPAGRPVPGLFAVGDVTTVSTFTHSANYQAVVVADELTGRGRDADLSAVPRAVYTDPAVFCVGAVADPDADAYPSTWRTSRIDLADVERAALVRTATGAHRDANAPSGGVELVADASTGVLVGAACVGPEADSWGAELALAVRARLPVELLAEQIRAFPTWSEAISLAAVDLRETLRHHTPPSRQT